MSVESGGTTRSIGRHDYLRWSILGFGVQNILVLLILPLIVSGGYSVRDPVFIASLLALPSYAVLYALIRRGHYDKAAKGFVLATFLIAWLFTVSLQGTAYMTGDYGYLATVSLFAALFLRVKHTAIYSALNIAGVVGLFFVWPFAARDFTLSLSFLAVFSIMLVLISSLRQRDAVVLEDHAQRLEATSTELRRANHELNMIFDNTDEAMLLVGPDGLIKAANRRATDLAGQLWGEQPKPGRALMDIIPAQHRDRAEIRLGQAKKSGPVRSPFEVGGRHFSVGFVHLRDGSILVLSTDVTAQFVQAQEEKSRLERQAKVAQLEAVNRMQRDFMTVASHELQNPLTPLRLQLHVLRDRQTGDLTHNQLRCLDVIERNALRLSHLVDEILDVVRIGNRQLKVELGDVELVELTRQEMERVIPMANAKRVGLSYDGPKSAWARADARRIENVIRGLLDNALKFVRPGGTVHVKVDAGDMVHWKVVDDGIGFAPQDAERLFEPFTQLHDAADLYGGSGLGLAISKGYLEAQGGRIEVRSEGLGRGTVASFWLPLATQTVEH